MSETVVAIIVAGSGAASEKEVFDLIEDSTGKFDSVDLVVPVSKSLFTEAVDAAVAWYPRDADQIIGVKIDGETTHKKAKGIGGDDVEEFDTFEEVFADSWDDFDEIHFYVALPEPEDASYDLVVGWIEAAEASETNFVVKNLCAGLDDVVLMDIDAEPEPEQEQEPEPETKVEPEKPVRKSRGRAKAEPVEEEKEEEEEVTEIGTDEKEEMTEVESDTRMEKTGIAPDPALQDVLSFLNDVTEYLKHTEALNRFWYLDPTNMDSSFVQRAVAARDIVRAGQEGTGVVPEATEPVSEPEKATEEPASVPSKGRGRPRTNFEDKEIFDADEDRWIPRPRGRITRGTKWRVVHSESGETLDEGTV